MRSNLRLLGTWDSCLRSSKRLGFVEVAGVYHKVITHQFLYLLYQRFLLKRVFKPQTSLNDDQGDKWQVQPELYGSSYQNMDTIN